MDILSLISKDEKVTKLNSEKVLAFLIKNSHNLNFPDGIHFASVKWIVSGLIKVKGQEIFWIADSTGDLRLTLDKNFGDSWILTLSIL